MTTIAYKDGIIAYDSQLTKGDIISRSNYDKKKETDRYIYFLGGATNDYEAFIKAVEDDQAIESLDCSGYVFDKEANRLYVYSIAEKEDCTYKIIKTPVDRDTVDAMGSGERFAYAAMDLGKTAKEAIEYACTRDIYTGGVIRVFKLP